MNGLYLNYPVFIQDNIEENCLLTAATLEGFRCRSSADPRLFPSRPVVTLPKIFGVKFLEAEPHQV